MINAKAYCIVCKLKKKFSYYYIYKKPRILNKEKKLDLKII